LSNRQNNVPIAIGVPVWERHLAAIPIEAGRLSHKFMPLRPNGTYFSQTLYHAPTPQITTNHLSAALKKIKCNLESTHCNV